MYVHLALGQREISECSIFCDHRLLGHGLYILRLGTLLLAFVAAIIAICAWPLRERLREIRWGMVISLVALQLVMKAPVWWVINHINIAGGGSYHRAMIVDQCIRHFADWWLVGIRSTAEWGWDMWDSANQFVSEAESGGLATLVCFVALIVLTFRNVGAARKAVRGNKQREWLLWLLGTTMFSFVVSFFGICFMDQATAGWLVVLAISVVAAAPARPFSSPDTSSARTLPPVYEWALAIGPLFDQGSAVETTTSSDIVNTGLSDLGRNQWRWYK